MQYDLKIVNGTVVDGTGSPRVLANVAIRDGKIVEVGACEGQASRTIDATGAIVTPGWTDIHTHYDGQVSWDSDLAPSCNHGVTTAVLGNCGVGFAPVRDWVRAYSEINEFEEQLVEHGIAVAKIWLQIDPEEQLARFEERQKTGFKRFKITDEDWRNREKWDDYRTAINDMVERTSTELAPWTLVPANDKRYARVAVLEALCETVERTLGMKQGKNKPAKAKRPKK